MKTPCWRCHAEQDLMPECHICEGKGHIDESEDQKKNPYNPADREIKSMSYRDWFAGLMAQGLATRGGFDTPRDLTDEAYRLADSMFISRGSRRRGV